jgi:hypothetical protein
MGRLELLAALGRLPRQLGQLEAQRDVIQIIDGIVRILERHKVNDERAILLVGGARLERATSCL